MFCDGVCSKKHKKCGMLTEIWLEKKSDGKKEKIKQCMMLAQLESTLRMEHLLDGLHAAQNSTRNETASGLNKIKDVIGTGMVGMLKSVEKRGKISG